MAREAGAIRVIVVSCSPAIRYPHIVSQASVPLPYPSPQDPVICGSEWRWSKPDIDTPGIDSRRSFNEPLLMCYNTFLDIYFQPC